MSQEGFSLSATLKGGTGYDAPWIVVYANDPNELKAKLSGIAEAGVLQATVDAANLLKGANNAGPITGPAQQAPPQAAPAPQPVQQQPWGQQAPSPTQQPAQQAAGGPVNGSPHPEGKQCTQCGSVLQWKAFTSKAGKNLKMWTCPNGRSQGDGHVSEFVW